MVKYMYIAVKILHFVCLLEATVLGVALSKKDFAHEIHLRPLLKFRNNGKSFSGLLLPAADSTYGRSYDRTNGGHLIQIYPNFNFNNNNPDEFGKISEDVDKGHIDKTAEMRLQLGRMSLDDIITFINLRWEQEKRLPNMTNRDLTDLVQEGNDDYSDNDDKIIEEDNKDDVYKQNSSLVEPIFFGLKRSRL